MTEPVLRAYIQLMGWEDGRIEPRIPTKAHETDAGWDLYTSRDTLIEGQSMADVPTDIRVAIPDGWFLQIKGRSSTSKTGIIVMEGVVDAGYRGELFYMVYNPSKSKIEIPRGTRYAQILVLPVPTVHWIQVADLPNSFRGSSGFGSSGR